MENCMLPFYGGFIGQGPGINSDGSTKVTYSHDGYRAIDVTPTDKLVYAPCKVKCVYHDRISYTNENREPCQSAKLAVFTSVEKVKCPEFESVVTFLFTHGGEVIPTAYGNLEASDIIIYNQGDLIYRTGVDAGIVNGKPQTLDEHVHINVKLGTFSTFNYVGVPRYITLFDDVNIERVCYKREGDNITIFDYYTLPTFISVKDDGQWNGWIADGSEWYYYKNGVKASGWLKTSDGTFYLDPNNGDAMLTGWFKEGSSNYYFNPKAGEAGHQEKYVGGVMLTGWQWIDEHWYLFGEGGVMQTGWVWSQAYQAWYYFYTSGAEAGQMAKATWIEDIYYVLSDGKMAKNCQIRHNGKYYAFNNSGACLNTAGQTTQYNTTTYPMKS